MSQVNIYLLDESNIQKEELNLKKPTNYIDLLNQLEEKIENMPEQYEIFIIDKNYLEIKIKNQENFELIEDTLFIREIDKNILGKSLFQKNFEKLSDSKQDILSEAKLEDITLEQLQNIIDENNQIIANSDNLDANEERKCYIAIVKAQSMIISKYREVIRYSLNEQRGTKDE